MSTETRIIATIGPSSCNEEIIASMIDAGMDMVRLNFSWGTHESHREVISRVRTIAKEKGLFIPIIQDISGPRYVDVEGHHFDYRIQDFLTQKDKDDLLFGIGMSLEYVALSFVGSTEDVDMARVFITSHQGDAKIIAKIERKNAFENRDAIVKSSDGIMVARGDLGHEIPLEEIPFVQEELIVAAHTHKKPVIVATGMMTSMMKSPTPSRADISDVSVAVLKDADAVMLSDETAVGEYPVEVVAMMEKVLVASELRKTTRPHSFF